MEETAIRLIWESKHIMEWAGMAAELPVQLELVELQRRLVRWQFEWETVWSVSEKRMELGALADFWSKRVLAFSGLLDSGGALTVMKG